MAGSDALLGKSSALGNGSTGRAARINLVAMTRVLIISAVICVLWMAFAIYSTIDVGSGGSRFTVGDLVGDSRHDRGSYFVAKR
jgi:hypothetical protein